MVGDRIPPKIVYSAQDKTVECDGLGNTEELSQWLKDHGGAWARGYGSSGFDSGGAGWSKMGKRGRG